MYKKRPILAVEGNIGAGKSTFLSLAEKALQAHLIYEPLEEWRSVGGENLLDYCYKDPARWSYAFQTYAFFTRIRAQEQAVQTTRAPLYLLERSVYSDRHCFAQTRFEQGAMKPIEWNMYQEWFSWLVESAPAAKPDAFIYLRTDPTISFERLRKRSRSEETTVSYEYLELIHRKHEEWLMHPSDVPVLVLACDEDFEHTKKIWDAHISRLVEFLSVRLHLPAHMTVLPTQEVVHE